MRRLARAPNIAVAALWADALCQAGFDASVQRYYLGSIAGDLPPDQCLPEVWIGDDAREAAAREMLDALRSMPQRRWACACGEVVEGGFGSCWNCGRMMPA